MMSSDNSVRTKGQQEFLNSLTAFTKEHRASHWSGPLSEYLEKIV